MRDHYKNVAIQLVADDETDISKELVEKAYSFAPLSHSILAESLAPQPLILTPKH
jgi:hypothetical protein